MKQVIMLIGVLLLLAACTNEVNNEMNPNEEGSSKSDSSLTIKEAKLTEREQSIVNQVGIDYKTFFMIDGELAEDETLVSSIIVYQDGDGGKEQLTSYDGMGEEVYDKALHSFQLHMQEDIAFFTIGSPSGYSKGSTEMPKDLQGYIFDGFDGEVTFKKGETVYLSYLKGSSENQMSSVNLGDYKTLPDSVKDAEYAVVAQLSIQDDMKDKE
ncbi:hypothetical protein [Guptibacillus algicola]|uniref:hypothetical protein n=1 Tax=Guptibacillus algicola TaxID=225844 RepID=UPI001CD71C66|nr:hypothetical protein [Alkalihalobacillus algicola]MCA0987408.1 hypothetical protein [Alkalihalobacillus algicola]